MATPKTQQLKAQFVADAGPSGISAKEANRRARQSASAKATPPPNAPAAKGEMIEEDAQAAYQRRVAATNLDEVVDRTTRVAFKVKQPDGTVGVEIIDLVIDMPIDLTMAAMQVKDGLGENPDAYATISTTVELVHKGVQVTRPNMTLAEMTFGLSTQKILKLFSIFFG